MSRIVHDDVRFGSCSARLFGSYAGSLEDAIYYINDPAFALPEFVLDLEYSTGVDPDAAIEEELAKAMSCTGKNAAAVVGTTEHVRDATTGYGLATMKPLNTVDPAK